MGNSLHIMGIIKDGHDGLPAEDVFQTLKIRNEPDRLGHYYFDDEENGGFVSIDEADGKAIHIFINRPGGTDEFWATVFTLVSRGPYFAVLSDVGEMIIANPEYIPNLPEEVEKDFKLVTSADEFLSKLLGK